MLRSGRDLVLNSPLNCRLNYKVGCAGSLFKEEWMPVIASEYIFNIYSTRSSS